MQKNRDHKFGLFQRIKEHITHRGVSTKMLNLVIISVMVAITVTTSITLINSNEIIDAQNKDASIGSLSALKANVESIKLEEKMRAEQLASNYLLITNMRENDLVGVSDIFSTKSSTIDHIYQAIVDPQGNVMVSSSKFYPIGKNVIDEPLVKTAISGYSGSTISGNSDIKLGVFAVAPIVVEDKLFGIVINTYDFKTTDVLDKLKTDYKSDFTLFAGNTRLNTTIMKDNTKIVGTTLDEKIGQKIIDQKNDIFGQAKILGVNYSVAYSPIVADNGQIIGIYFAGNDLTPVNAKISQSYLYVITFAMIAVILIVIISNYVVQKAVRMPLKHMIAIMDHIAKGELSHELKQKLKEINSNDEIKTLSMSMNSVINSIYDISSDVGTLRKAAMEKDLTVRVNDLKYQGIYHDIIFTVNKMFQEIKQIVHDISEAADEISIGANHSASASINLAEGTTKQANIIESLSHSVLHIAEISKQNVINTQNANGSMTVTKFSIDESNQHMKSVIVAMEEIDSKSKEINKIVKTIDDIAFQTNILALNATIEAARAGQAGKGFAVVAEEVKNLANKSAQAASMVSELICRTAIAVEHCTAITKNTEQYLEKAVIESNHVLIEVETIKTASESSHQSIAEISCGMENINEIVQNNAAIAEETAASSAELADQSLALKQMVKEYKW